MRSGKPSASNCSAMRAQERRWRARSLMGVYAAVRRAPERGVGAVLRPFTHIVARPVRKKTNWVFAVGRLTACDALAASLCGLVVRVGECGEVSKACAVQRAASAVVSSSPFVQQASLGSSSGGWMTPAAGWNLSRPHNGRQWLNRSVLTYSRGSEPLALRRRAQ